MPDQLRFQFIPSIHDCPREHWQGLLAQANIHYPFIQFNYLAALEDSKSCVLETGWQTKHCLIYEGCQLVGLMPCYEKHHSYGEYVFDQQWAQAYQEQGLNYYPKLVSSIPFTPCVGARLVLSPRLNRVAVEQALLSAIAQLCHQQKYSGWHYLFAEADQCIEQLPTRLGVQFHWYNRNYKSFDDFLVSFSSRKRKAVLKERRRVKEQGFVITRVNGAQASVEDWQRFYHFYQLTYAKRSGHGGYLTEAFFQQIASTFAEHCLLIFAEVNEKIVAGALYFIDEDNLYGRYWGCYEEYAFLHFECCYYQGIDYCIENGLAHIDAGAQGEHKIQRGFEPITTYSSHYLAHQGFHHAIKQFTEEEAPHIHAYRESCEQSLPFKKQGS